MTVEAVPNDAVSCCVQALLPPVFLLAAGITIFATAEQARFKNYQKHGGGEVMLLPPTALHCFCCQNKTCTSLNN